jgi:nucleotide-binding universal stress UspA family protein
MFERILVALDGSEAAEEVLPPAEEVAAKFGSALILMQVVPLLSSASVAASPAQDPTQVQRLEQQAADAYLTAAADRLRARGRTVSTAQPQGHPAQEIVDYARREGIGLIALTTHGRSTLRSLVFGSVAQEVLQKAPCPVLLVRIGQETAG